jgi:phenylalanyl-tRNA synthetase beta chain
MFISYNWLKEYIDINVLPKELSNIMNLYGLPVEEMIEIKQKFSNVFITKILDIQKHPNADNLTICKVTDNKEIYNVVCGAKNIKIGDVVPFAKDGAVLPGNVKIKTTKIRGIDSFGMLCSAKELGISDDHAGILLLDSEKNKIGDPFIAFEPDTIFNLEITPNRPDLLCITGVARFLSFIFDKKIKYPSYNISNTNIDKLLDINEKIKIEVLDSELCPRYTARFIEGVKVGESPDWLKRRLEACNIRPINNIVDVTNYILLELNQPLHAFDYDKLQNKKIKVRKALSNESIVALDDKSYNLNVHNLIIADDARPIAIAGIMGGKNFSINNSTDKIILESAFFDSKSIRKTSKTLNVSSDSSYRFERGIDIENVHNALNRATELIINIAGGKASKNYIDCYPLKFKRKQIIVRYDRINKLLGLNLTKKKIEFIIKKFNYEIKRKNNKFIKVKIPGYRIDIKQEVDLIEDVAQVYGYENIPNTMPVSSLVLGRKTKMQSFINLINNQMVSFGFSESINYSFLNDNVLNQINEPSFIQENPVLLGNPFNSEEKQLKTTLIPDLLKNLITNYYKENQNIHLFEIGKVYMVENNDYIEQMNLCLVSLGNIILQDYNNKGFITDFYFLKSIIINIINEITDVNNISFIPSDSGSFFYEYYSTIMINDKIIIGKIGRVREEILYKNKIRENVFISEININNLLNYFPKNVIFKKLSIHPIVKRDISIIVPANIQEFIIEKIIYKSSENLIKDLVLCDLYKGEQIPDKYKSLTYSITLQSFNKTLTENEINMTINNIIKNLKNDVQAELRS